MTEPAQRTRLGEREFVAFMAVLSAMSAFAIDTMIPAFAEMRQSFELPPDSTRLSLTLTLFFLGTGVGVFFFGPLADSQGRRRAMNLGLGLYVLCALGAAVAPGLGVLYVSRFLWGFAAAGPRVLSQAVLRDRFEGQSLARAMTLVMTFFYLAPILAPVVGKVVLELAGWRWVFGVLALLGTAVVTWGVRLPETLAPENRRPFSLQATVSGLGQALRHPVTRYYTLSVVFGFGAFFSFLGGSELVLSEVYNRPELFVPTFAVLSALMGVMAFVANRTLKQVQSHDWTLGAGCVFVVASAILLIVTLASDGLPALAVFLPLFSLAIVGFAAVFPTANSIALEPMGALAGTAAAGMAGSTMILGALMAALIDRSIAGTVTPLALGYTVYSAIALCCQLLGRRALRSGSHL